MEATLIAYPAYGRCYTTPERMKQDFLDGKDFSSSMRGGPYFSIRDFIENDNCKDFQSVSIYQHRVTRNGRISVQISRLEMDPSIGKVKHERQSTEG